MKTTFILMLFLFSLSGIIAQESRYFDINRGEKYEGEYTSTAFLDPKQRKKENLFPRTGYIFTFNEEFVEITHSIFNETFGEMDIETAMSFSPFAYLNLYFDKNLKVYTYQYTVRRKNLNQILVKEENLYAFAEKCLELDLSPFIEINNKELQEGCIVINMYMFYLYEHEPHKIRYQTYWY